MAALADHLELAATVLTDPERRIYRLLGLPRAPVWDRLADAISGLTAYDAKAVELLGATGEGRVSGSVAAVPELAATAGSGSGRVVLELREVAHPAYPDAVVRTPALVALDVADHAVYRSSVRPRGLPPPPTATRHVTERVNQT